MIFEFSTIITSDLPNWLSESKFNLLNEIDQL